LSVALDRVASVCRLFAGLDHASLPEIGRRLLAAPTGEQVREILQADVPSSVCGNAAYWPTGLCSLPPGHGASNPSSPQLIAGQTRPP
jgi:hypothetical protein